MIPADEWHRLTRRGFWLEYASMAWMTVEAAAAIAAGIVASSIALIGFGLDSVIEFFAAGIVVWQLRSDSGERETRAVRLIGITFFVLAAYLTAESIQALISRAMPEQSVLGLAVAAAAFARDAIARMGQAAHRTGPEQPDSHRGCCRKRLLRLRLGRGPDRFRPERLAAMVVG